MRRSIDDATDDHPADDDERPPVSWAVALSDDCDACGMGEPRVVLTVEEVVPPAWAWSRTWRRRPPAASAPQLPPPSSEIGEDPGP